MSSDLITIGDENVLALDERYKRIQALKNQVFQKGIHYGEPFKAAGKPTLLKPGAEAICVLFGFYPDYEELTRTEDFDKPLFYYRYRCIIRQIGTNTPVGTGIGSCNSMEDKYAYRWVSADEVPSGLTLSKLPTQASTISEFDFAIEKGETSGPYGKPAEYWQMFRDAIRNNQARKIMRDTKKGQSAAWEIASVKYRIPNPEIFSLINTIDKMAQKRAMIAAVLAAAGASPFFTQDVEDFGGYTGAIIIDDHDAVDGEIVYDEPRRYEAPPTSKRAEQTSTDDEPSTPSQGELVIRIKPAKNGSRSYSCRAEVPAGEKGEMQMEWVSCFGSDLFHAAGYDTDTWPKPSEGENTVNFRLIPTPVIIAAKNGNYWNITKVIHPEDRAGDEQIATIEELGGRVYGAAWLDGDSDSNGTAYRVWAAIKASNDNRGKPWRVRELNELTEDEADSVIETLQAKLEKPAQPKAKTTTAPSAGKPAKATTMHVLDETAASLYGGEASLDQLEILVKQFGTDTTINTLTEEQAQELIAHIAAQLKEGEPDTPAHDEMASTTELSTEAWIALQQLCAHYGTPDNDALDELIAFGYVEDDITEAGFKLLLSRYGANDKNNYEDFLLGLNIPSAEANKIWRGNTAGHEAGKMQINPGIGYKNGFLGAMCLISLKRMEEGA